MLRGRVKKMQEENNIQRQILLGVSRKSPETRLFRNNVGLGYMGTVAREEPPVIVLRNYRHVKYGLHVGSSDLIGWRSIEITPDMVGKRIAVFASVEVKTKTGKPTADQKNWIDQVRKAGGIAGVVRSTDEAIELLSQQAGKSDEIKPYIEQWICRCGRYHGKSEDQCGNCGMKRKQEESR